MNFLNKKTRVKIMAQALVMTSIVGVGTGYNLMVTEPIHVSASTDTSEVFTADSVACGSVRTYYLKSDGTVYQTGLNDTSLPTYYTDNVARIVSSMEKTMFIKKDGTVWGEGINNTLVQVPITNVIDVVCGNEYAMFIKNDGTVWGIGKNSSGQLGIGNKTDQSSPVQVPITNVKNISCGDLSTAFTKNDGTVWMTGNNVYGQLGDGTTTARISPVQVAGVTGIQKTVSTRHSTFFIKTDGTLWGCGANHNYRRYLGLASTIDNQLTPVKLSLTGVKDVLYSADSVAFLKTDGTVYVTGYNYDTQFGSIGSPYETGFLRVSAIPTTYKSMALGEAHSVFVKADGTVWACGNNQEGQIGVGGKLGTSRYSYAQVGIDEDLKITHTVSTTDYTKSAVTITIVATPPTGTGLNYFKFPDGNYADSQYTPTSIITMDVSNGYKIISSVPNTYFSPTYKVVLKNVTHNGDYRVRFVGRDGDDIIYTVNVSNIDTTAPSIISIDKGTVTNGSIPITIKATDTISADGTSGIKRIKTPSGYTTGDTAIYKATTIGTFSFTAEDNAGNTVIQTLTTTLADFYDSNIIEQAVAKAEVDKTQVNYDNALAEVNKIPTCAEKTAFTTRLTLVKTYLTNVTSATTKVVNAEKYKTQTYITTAQTAINLLPVGDVNRIALQQRLDLIASYPSNLTDATAKVGTAENTKTQANVDLAQTAINLLPTGDTNRTALQGRLDVVKAYIAQLATATSAVVKAESSKLQADIDSAKPLVNALPDGIDKTDLLIRLNKIIPNSDSNTTNITNATNAVVKAEGSKLQADVDSAKTLVDSLTDSVSKTNLTNRLNAVQTYINNVIDAINKVVTAETTKTKTNVDIAQTAINKLPYGKDKSALQARLNLVITDISNSTNSSSTLNTTETLVKLAESMKRNPYIANAQTAVTKLVDSPEKTAFQVRIDKLKASTSGGSTGGSTTTNSATALNTTGITVRLAESMKREPYITQAQNAINKLVDSTEKTAFQVRLDKVKASINTGGTGTPGQTTNSATALNTTGITVSLAESMKRDPYITQAQTAIDKLADSAEKTAFQERLDKIKNPVVVDTKLAEATTAVVQAEKYKYSYYTNKATTLVNALPDSQDKTDLLTRIANIK